jgi:hypothetical protein
MGTGDMAETQTMSQQLNEKVIAALPVPSEWSKVHYFSGAVLGGCVAPDGLGVRVTAAGVRSFVLGYRQKDASAG